VITGAASGIGRAIALAFGRQGCRIVAADVEAPALGAIASELADKGIECLPVETDVSSAESVDVLAQRALERHGAVHILCNNAGVSLRKPLLDQSLADWRWMLGVDLWGPIHGLRSFLPVLLQQDEAHVVNTSSVAGLLPFPMGGPYNHGIAKVV
jgi:NAD(P)-dependent dehydrogenase (short-subunit alcohol dehydrogenase family)